MYGEAEEAVVRSGSFKRSLKRRRMWFTSISCVLLLIIFEFSSTASSGDPGVKDLEGINIRSAWFTSGTVTLKNGEYRGPARPGSATETVVRLTDQRAFGPMNGKDSAAIVIVTDPGGSGLFYDLVMLEMKQEGWVYADSVLLGDRVKVHSVGIKDNEISVSMTVHGPGDAMCCPTQEVTRRFMVQAEHLVAENYARSDIQDPGIIGPVWHWVRTRYNDDTTLTPPVDFTGYTLQLNSDGTVQVRGDCNRGGGTFAGNGKKLSITITYSTMATCPEGSLEGQFFRDLNRTGGFLIKNARLFLDLKFDTGTMEFQKQ